MREQGSDQTVWPVAGNGDGLERGMDWDKVYIKIRRKFSTFLTFAWIYKSLRSIGAWVILEKNDVMTITAAKLPAAFFNSSSALQHFPQSAITQQMDGNSFRITGRWNNRTWQALGAIQRPLRRTTHGKAQRKD